MPDRLRTHVRQNLIAYLALFVALGGTSYAAAANITSQQIVDGTIQGRDIKDGSVKSADIGDGSLLAKDFKTGALPAGPRGLPGPKGDKGDPGSAGATGAKGDKGAPGAKGDQGPPGAKGDQGIQGVQGKQGIQGVPGKDGTNGADGTARAYAHILANGTTDTNNTMGMTAYTHPNAGLYCLYVYGGAWHVATASIDFGGADTRDPIAVYKSTSESDGCPVGWLLVSTRSWNGGAADRPFYVVVN